jgi:hypothetical protein
MRLKKYCFVGFYLMLCGQSVQAQYHSKFGIECGVFTGVQHHKSQSIPGLRMCSGLGVNVHVPIVWHKLHGLLGMGVMPQISNGALLENAQLIRTRCLYSTVNAGLEYRMNLPQFGNQWALYTGFNHMLKLAETNVWNSFPNAGFPAIWAGNYNSVSAGLGCYRRRGNLERKFQVTVDFSRYLVKGKKANIGVSGISITCALLRLDAPKPVIVNNRIARTLMGPATPD